VDNNGLNFVCSPIAMMAAIGHFRHLFGINIFLQKFRNYAWYFLKGQLCEIFILWLLSSIDPVWIPFAYTTAFSNSVSNSPSYSNSKLVLHYGPLRGTNFVTDNRDLIKLEWYRPWLLLFIHIHFLASLSLKWYDKLLKNCCVILHCDTLFGAMAHSL
jgi:hypothetical protein